MGREYTQWWELIVCYRDACDTNCDYARLPVGVCGSPCYVAPVGTIASRARDFGERQRFRPELHAKYTLLNLGGPDSLWHFRPTSKGAQLAAAL